MSLGFDSACGVHRRRSLNPPGVFVDVTVVVQLRMLVSTSTSWLLFGRFHPRLVTKVDRAFTFQCFYMEAMKTVDTLLAVR
jgi:hypothetical protein